MEPKDFIITRKRKLYKFALFKETPNCFFADNINDLRTKLSAINKPITIEIGSGSGVFLTELARRHPDRYFVAIDRKSDRLLTGARIAVDNRLTNISFLWLKANNLKSVFAPNTIDQIWITFPDPWPQKSNEKHRLTNKKRLATYRKLLVVTGSLCFKTDSKPLFDWSVEQLANNWQIDYLTYDLHKSDLPIDADALVMTSYEQRFINDGLKINYLSASIHQTL